MTGLLLASPQRSSAWIIISGKHGSQKIWKKLHFPMKVHFHEKMLERPWWCYFKPPLWVKREMRRRSSHHRKERWCSEQSGFEKFHRTNLVAPARLQSQRPCAFPALFWSGVPCFIDPYLYWYSPLSSLVLTYLWRIPFRIFCYICTFKWCFFKKRTFGAFTAAFSSHCVW